MISAHLRRTARTLYAFSCGYCGVSKAEVGAYLTIDHFIPKDAGGSDDIENLIEACHACNMYKSAAWNSQNPPVLHPLQTDISRYIRPLSDGTLQGLTREGARHIETLHLNRPPMVERRKMRLLIQGLMERETRRSEREERLDAEMRKKKQTIRRKSRG